MLYILIHTVLVVEFVVVFVEQGLQFMYTVRELSQMYVDFCHNSKVLRDNKFKLCMDKLLFVIYNYMCTKKAARSIATYLWTFP